MLRRLLDRLAQLIRCEPRWADAWDVDLDATACGFAGCDCCDNQ